MRYAIAAAGTGGHIFPALAVAGELVERGVATQDIVFVGGDRLEASAIPAAGFDLISVEMRGLRRSLSLSNLSLPVMVFRAAGAVAGEFRRRGVNALLVMGGYITVPAAMAARRCRVPFVLHEQNGRPGLANRLVARRAARVLIAFPEAAERLARAELVGNPLRRDLIDLDKATRRRAARARYDLGPEGVVMGVMGGSQGAASINEAVARYAATPDRPPIVHLAGTTHAEALAEQAAGASIPWRIVPFENSMEDFYAACDLVVARAGASTVSELAATGTPSLLIPLEAVAQQNNAAYLSDAGAAIVLRQSRLEVLAPTLRALLSDGEKLSAMSQAATAASHPRAASRVAEALMDVAG